MRGPDIPKACNYNYSKKHFRQHTVTDENANIVLTINHVYVRKERREAIAKAVSALPEVLAALENVRLFILNVVHAEEDPQYQQKIINAEGAKQYAAIAGALLKAGYTHI